MTARAILRSRTTSGFGRRLITAAVVLLRLIQIIKVRTAAFDLGKSLLFFSRLPFGSQ
jgi:hypothetical protein